MISRFPLSGFKFPVSDLRSLISAFLLLFPLCASALSDPALLPDGREPIALRPGERNPFTQKAVQYEDIQEGPKQVSEESRLRRILSAVKISGLSGGNGKFQVLLGSLIIKPGDTLPPLIGNQVEQLRVTAVDNSSLTLSFIEKDPAADARQPIVLHFNTRPAVKQFLSGEAAEMVIQSVSKTPPKMKDVSAAFPPAVEAILTNSQAGELTETNDKFLMGTPPDARKPEQ